jgi:hypothetical protein
MKLPKRIDREYEGPEILGDLLQTSGCELTVDDVVDEISFAIEEGGEPADVLPLLWEREPRFKTPEDARRTFGNLLGLWDTVARAQIGELMMPEQDPDLPLRQDFVDRAWRELDTLSPRDLQRARDRFDNVQADLVAWVFDHLKTASPVAPEVALDVLFECWWLCDHARGAERVPRPTREALDRAWRDAADGEGAEGDAEPALASLTTATLWEQNADEERPLPEEDISTVERVLRVARRALGAPPVKGN